MSTILVEARRDPANGPALDRIAEACRVLGHDTFRWRGPLSGRVRYWRTIFPCDVAIVWNGAHPRYAAPLAKLRARGAKLLFAELGWNPQPGTIQLDSQGINARSSWAAEPLSSAGRQPLAIRGQGDLLTILQLDRDTQITQLSPWFANMQAFVEFVVLNSALPVRVRPHPRQPLSPALARAILERGGSIDDSSSFAQALERARAVATINSSCGVEALAAGLPVLSYGQAIYRHRSAVYCLTDDAEATRDATAALAAGSSNLYREPIEELTRRIAAHQWRIDQIAARLPAVLAPILPPMPSAPKRTSWLGRMSRFTRDLPERLLVPRAAA